MTFDGTNDFIAASDNQTLDITGTMTVSLWFKLTGAATEYDGLFMKSSSSFWSDGYGLYFTDDFAATKSVVFFINSYDGTGGGIGRIALNYTTDTSWHHVLGIYDGTNVSIYLDGTQGTSGAFTGAVTMNDRPLHIGKGEDVPYAVDLNGLTVPAKIDDARLYDRALSSSEIQALAGGGIPSMGEGTNTLQTNLNIDGTLRFYTGTLDAGANRQINVGGDWENFGGIFAEQSGTVVLDGTNQWIPAAETFYNLSKTLTAAPSRTLTFGYSSTVTVTNTLTLNGYSASSKLNLRSSSVGTRFNIKPTAGLATVNYVDVQDSEALSNNIRTNNSTNSGNTDFNETAPYWLFGPLRGALMQAD